MHITRLIFAASVATTLIACHHEEDATDVSYQISVTNLTHNQPMSPLAVAIHQDGYSGWSPGMPASGGLEQLAEGGTTDPFLDEAANHQQVEATASGAGLILPGGMDSITLMSDLDTPQLTIVSMLVNTNDGFTGLSGIDLSSLENGDSLTRYSPVMDAGTEANSEAAATLPGPAGGGEGYNATREDHNFVAIHPGVVTADDGLMNSALDSSHRFDNPAARIVITRID